MTDRYLPASEDTHTFTRLARFTAQTLQDKHMTKSPQCSVRVCGKEMPGLFMQGFYTHSVTFYSSWSLITFNTLKEGGKKKHSSLGFKNTKS